MFTKRTLILMAILVAAGILLMACVPPPPPGAPQQSSSNTLNLLCTPQVEWCEGMEGEFEAAHPDINVEWVRMSSGESLTRLRNEKENPQFDIWWGGPIDSFIAASAEDLLETYDSPNHANIVNKDLMLSSENQWAGIYVGSLGFATNSEWLEENPDMEAPNAWDDLLAEELAGQLMVAHPSSSGTSYTALCTILQVKGEEEGWEFLRDYAGQVNQFTKSGSAPASFVGGGEAAVGIVFSHDIVKRIEDGLPLVLSFPEEGTGYEVGGMGIVKGAKNLENAKKWYDWALEPATQEIGPKYGAYQAPTVKGATPPMPELLEVNLIDYDFVWCGEHKKEFVDRFTNEIAGAADLKE
ncbi:MAG: ABC transporter substrate-binding protein [Chloroflexota bacterium]|nr:ABC transporter substrate-binding protein [Chloroflexota bacterium]